MAGLSMDGWVDEWMGGGCMLQQKHLFRLTIRLEYMLRQKAAVCFGAGEGGRGRVNIFFLYHEFGRFSAPKGALHAKPSFTLPLSLSVLRSPCPQCKRAYCEEV